MGTQGSVWRQQQLSSSSPQEECRMRWLLLMSAATLLLTPTCQAHGCCVSRNKSKQKNLNQLFMHVYSPRCSRKKIDCCLSSRTRGPWSGRAGRMTSHRAATLLCCAILWGSVALASAASCSHTGFNFFPRGTTNVPEAWTKANQTAAGNECSGRLLPIAIYGTPKPVLHFMPVHLLLKKAANVPNSLLPGKQQQQQQQRQTQQAPPKALRRLLPASGDSNWTVASPAQFSFQVLANGKLWYESQPYSQSSGVPVIDFNANMTENRRDIFDPSIFQEGINNVTIVVTLHKHSANITNGPTNMSVPEANITLHSPPIDFYFFMHGRPEATVSFHSCQTDLSMAFANTAPAPVMLDGYRLTEEPGENRTAFFLPVYYIYGSYVRGLDGSTDQVTDNTEGNAKSFGMYITRLPGAPANFSVMAQELNNLKEGWYSFSVEGSIWSPQAKLDSLMSVSGKDKYGNEDVVYRTVQPGGHVTDSFSLLGGFKGSGWLLPAYNQTPVGLQKGPSYMDFFEGPGEPLTLGGKAAFTWGFTGLGTASCLVNGVNISPGNGSCSSPLVLPIRTTANQTLELSFRDVCGAVFNSSIRFGTSFGWELLQQQAVMPVEAPAAGAGGFMPVSGASGSLLLAAAKPSLMSKVNAAAGARLQAWTSLLGVAAAWLAALLLAGL